MNNHTNHPSTLLPFQYSVPYREQYATKEQHEPINNENQSCDHHPGSLRPGSPRQDQHMNGASDMTDTVIVHPKGDWTAGVSVIGRPESVEYQHPVLLPPHASSIGDSNNPHNHYELSHHQITQDPNSHNNFKMHDPSHHQKTCVSVSSLNPTRSNHDPSLLTSSSSSSLIPTSPTAQYASSAYGYDPVASIVKGYSQPYHHQLSHHQVEASTNNNFSNIISTQTGYGKPVPASRQQPAIHYASSHASSLMPNIWSYGGQSCYVDYSAYTAALQAQAGVQSQPQQHRSSHQPIAAHHTHHTTGSDTLTHCPSHGGGIPTTGAFNNNNTPSHSLISGSCGPSSTVTNNNNRNSVPNCGGSNRGTNSMIAPVLLQPTTTCDRSVPTQATSKLTTRSHRTSISPQVKRPRGRPRKHPLPFSAALTQQQQQQWENYQHQQALLLQQQQEGEKTFEPGLCNGQTGLIGFPASAYTQHQPLTIPTPHETVGKPINTDNEPLKGESRKSSKRKTNDKQALATASGERHERVEKYLHQRGQLYSHDVYNELQVLDFKLPQFKIGEEFYGFGGPFNVLSLGQRIQRVIELHQKLQEEEPKKEKDGGLASDHLSTVRMTSQELLSYHLHSESANGFLLNDSFVFSSVRHKMPIRDLVISRHHMAALCDDSTVFLYRHKTHPLVRTRVSQWEQVEALEGLSIVCMRLASGHLSPNWRERYHQHRRPLIIQNIRQELAGRSVRLPSASSELLSSSTSVVTREELEVFVSEHAEGILCVSYDELDPDWLPEPVVLAAIDSSGGMHVVRCTGYYNYPRAVRHEEQNWESMDAVTVRDSMDGAQDAGMEDDTMVETYPSETIGSDGHHNGEDKGPVEHQQQLQPEPMTQSRKPMRLSALTTQQETAEFEDPTQNKGLLTKTTAATSSTSVATSPSRRSYEIQRSPTKMDIIDKNADITVHVKDEGGNTMKVKAIIQDIALGELTGDFLLEGTAGFDVPMIISSVANNQHSAYVKGKNVFIRFKNFPTGVSKIYCGPLGHTGILLLSNGTIWSWKAERGRKHGKKKIGASIHQVKGSLDNRTAIDCMGLGAEFMALTSDGVIHEWNSYEPYLSRLTDSELHLTVPRCIDRPSIPEPIEWTPTFQRQLTKCSRDRNFRPCYCVGGFSSFATGIASRQPAVHPLIDTHPVTIPATETPVEQPPLSPFLPLPPNGSHMSRTGEHEPQQQQLHTASSIEDTHRQETETLNCFAGAPEFTAAATSTPMVTEGETQDYEKEQTDESGWRSSDSLSEERLEAKRQQEIYERYQQRTHERQHDPFERIYFMEGVTLAQTQKTGLFHVMRNRLADDPWRRADYDDDADDSYSSWQTRGATPSIFTLDNGQRVAQTCSAVGKPIAVNPVNVALQRISGTITVATAMMMRAADYEEQQLREELESMASDPATVTYRLVTAPNAVIVAVLRKTDKVELMKRLLLARPPTLITYDDVDMLMDAMTLFRPPKISKTVWNRKKQVRNSTTLKTERVETCSANDGTSSEKAKQPVKKKGGRSKRGRPKRKRRETGVRKLEVNEEEGLQQPHPERPPDQATSSNQNDAAIEPEGVKLPAKRTRERRQSQTLDQTRFFIPTPDTDKVWEEMLNLMENSSDGDDQEGPRKRHKTEKKRTRRDAVAPTTEETKNDDDSKVPLSPEQLAIVLKTLRVEFPVRSGNEDYTELSSPIKEENVDAEKQS